MRAVLFDVDGVLLDSYAGYREVWSRWCVLREVDLELAWAATHGRRPVETVAEVAPHLTPEDEYVVLKALLGEMGDLFPAFVGAAPLLHALPLESWGVVTSGQRATVLARFEAHGLPRPLVFVDGDDVGEGKPSPEGYLKAVLQLLGGDGEVALTSLQSYLDLEPRAQDSAFSTARTVLDAYEDPDIVDASVSWDITPEWLLDGDSMTLYLVANASDQTRLAPVFLAQLDEMLRAAFLAAAQRRARTGDPSGRPDGTTAPRLLLLLDEAANIAPIPDLATLASTAGGEGIQLVTIYQDLWQLRHRYGTEWGSIASNHVAKVVLPGVTAPETLNYFSATVGEEEVLMTSTASDKTGKRSTSKTVQRRTVLSQRDLRELPRWQGICVYGARPPTRFVLRRTQHTAGLR